jgi:hypothetical protein
MNATEKKKRRPAETALPNVKLHGSYHWALFLQAFRQKPATRRCVACDVRVTNSNLGGSDGRSALSGPLWCRLCADLPRHLLLNFNGAGAQ